MIDLNNFPIYDNTNGKFHHLNRSVVVYYFNRFEMKCIYRKTHLINHAFRNEFSIFKNVFFFDETPAYVLHANGKLLIFLNLMCDVDTKTKFLFFLF